MVSIDHIYRRTSRCKMSLSTTDVYGLICASFPMFLTISNDDPTARNPWRNQTTSGLTISSEVRSTARVAVGLVGVRTL